MKTTPQKGRAGRAARQSEETEPTIENDDAAEAAAEQSAPQANVGGDSLSQNEVENKVSEEPAVESEPAKIVAPVVESKPAPVAVEAPKEAPKVVEKKKLIRDPITVPAANDNKPTPAPTPAPVKTESAPAVPKEEPKKEEPVEKPKEPVHSIPILSVPAAEPVKEKPVEPVNESKLENNNLPPTLKPVVCPVANEQPIKTLPTEPAQPVNPAESKLENDSAEKTEVQTA